MTFRTSSLLARLGNGFGLFLGLGQLKQVNDDTGKKSNIQNNWISNRVSIYLRWVFSYLTFRGRILRQKPVAWQYKVYYKACIFLAELLVWMGLLFFEAHGEWYFLTWIESLSTYTGLKWSGDGGWGLGFESDNGRILGWYREKSEIIKLEDFTDWGGEGDRIITGYRWR